MIRDILTSPAQRVRAAGQRGIALVIVLWILTLLAVIVGEFCHAMKTEVNITRNFKEDAQAYYIARAGVFLGIAGLVRVSMMSEGQQLDAQDSDSGMSAWRVNADVPEVPFGGGRFKVLIGNESGKININSAGADLLRLGLNSVGLSDGEKETIVDSILDWRDEDNFHRANGAEDDYYRSLPRPYECKDAEFDSVDELLLVRGVTPEIFFDGLKNRFTVYGGDGSANPNRNWRMKRKQSSQININAAPPDVLMALPMMTQEAVDAIVEFRMEEEIKSVSDLADLVGADIYNAIKTHITFSNSPFYTVLSTGMLAGSSTRVGLEAMVEINGTYEGGFRIVEWRETPDPDRLASAEDSEGEAAEQGWSQEGSTFIRF